MWLTGKDYTMQTFIEQRKVVSVIECDNTEKYFLPHGSISVPQH